MQGHLRGTILVRLLVYLQGQGYRLTHVIHKEQGYLLILVILREREYPLTQGIQLRLLLEIGVLHIPVYLQELEHRHTLEIHKEQEYLRIQEIVQHLGTLLTLEIVY